jgi:hypothetical protein
MTLEPWLFAPLFGLAAVIFAIAPVAAGAQQAAPAADESLSATTATPWTRKGPALGGSTDTVGGSTTMGSGSGARVDRPRRGLDDITGSVPQTIIVPGRGNAKKARSARDGIR